MRESEFEFIRTLLYKHSRIHLGPDKRELVAARLGKRLRALNTATIGDYCKYLEGPDGEEEYKRLIDVLSTHHTSFFRENDHFAFVRDQVVPEMLERARIERWPCLRAWSAACSSGEEPYSLAITLAETLAPGEWGWRIEATDISHRVVDQAKVGVYPAATLDKISPARLRAHFQQGVGPQTGNYRVKPELKATVSFRQLNLLASPLPFQDPFHLIFCRNVMIYFDRPTQEELVNRLARLLVPGGYLLVGHAESLSGIRHPLQPVRPSIYRRSASS